MVTWIRVGGRIQIANFVDSSKPRTLSRSKSQHQNAKHVHAHVTKMDSPEAAGEGSRDDFMEKDAGTCPFLILTTFKKCRALKWVI